MSIIPSVHHSPEECGAKDLPITEELHGQSPEGPLKEIPAFHTLSASGLSAGRSH